METEDYVTRLFIDTELPGCHYLGNDILWDVDMVLESRFATIQPLLPLRSPRYIVRGNV